MHAAEGEASNNENPIHFTIKKEEECIIDDVLFDEASDSDDNEENLDAKGFQSSVEQNEPPQTSPFVADTEVSTVECSASIEFDSKTYYHPPSDMPSPPDVSEYSESDEVQFVLIKDDVEPKKTEDENVAIDTSLVDHQYSQPETSKQEFCYGLVQDILIRTGNENTRSAVDLLSKYTDLFEHFVEDPESQISLYLASMKSTLKNLHDEGAAAAKPEKPEEEKAESDELTSEEVKLINIPETPPLEDEQIKAENNLQEPPAEQEQPALVDTESVSKLKDEIKLVEDFGQTLSNDAKELLIQPLTNDEEAADVKGKLLSLLKDSREKHRELMKAIRGQRIVKQEDDNNEKSKNLLVGNFSYSSEYNTSDSEDLDQVVNVNRKIPKSGPQTPAIVSSTKEDSDISELDTSKEARGSRESSPESVSVRIKDIGRDIEKLADFSSLNCPKPASSKKVSKVKKVKKKKKSPSSDLESNLSFSSDDNSPSESSSSVSDGQRMFFRVS